MWQQLARQLLYERDRGLCCFCDLPVPFETMHIDHRQPRALGGGSDAGNLRVAHRGCNIAAGNEVAMKRRAMGMPPVTVTLSIYRLHASLIHAMRVECAARDIPISQLIADMWHTYQSSGASAVRS
jgi:5-methylcytosine-specific restriction endonuclease McrA